MIYESSSEGELITSIDQPSKPKRFYGKPDIELIMKDYVKLPTMEEVFFELIPRITLKKYLDGYLSTINPDKYLETISDIKHHFDIGNLKNTMNF